MTILETEIKIKGLSYYALSKETGVNPQLLARWVRGQSRPTVGDQFYRFVQCLESHGIKMNERRWDDVTAGQ